MSRRRRTIEQVIRIRCNSANYRADKLGVSGRLDPQELIDDWRCLGQFDTQTLVQRCPFCDKKLGVSNLSLDHIVPLSKGGTNFAINTQWCCIRDNRYRGNFSVTEYREFLKLLSEAGWLERFFQHYRPRGYGGR